MKFLILFATLLLLNMTAAELAPTHGIENRDPSTRKKKGTKPKIDIDNMKEMKTVAASST
jgi:hypothetical protein